MKFLLGLAVGVVLALAAPAIAATVSGLDSALVGWQVVKGGQTVCANPWADVVHSRIDCGN